MSTSYKIATFETYHGFVLSLPMLTDNVLQHTYSSCTASSHILRNWKICTVFKENTIDIYHNFSKWKPIL